MDSLASHIHLLVVVVLLGPTRKAAIALNSKPVAAVTAAKAADARAEAAERALLRRLRLLHRLCEGPLGKDRQTHGTRVLGASVEIRRSKESANGSRTRPIGRTVHQTEAGGAIVRRMRLMGLRGGVQIGTVKGSLLRSEGLLLLLLLVLLLLMLLLSMLLMLLLLLLLHANLRLLLLLILLSLQVHH